MAEPAQTAAMCKVLALGFLMFLAACSGDPRSFGITGPGGGPPPVAPPIASPDTPAAPGVSTTGPTYGPSTAPSTGIQRVLGIQLIAGQLLSHSSCPGGPTRIARRVS